MKIQYASDLHLEFCFELNNITYEQFLVPCADVLILAGDITLWADHYHTDPFFDYLSENWKYTYYIPGNHEFYTAHDVSITLKPFCYQIRKNVRFVNNMTIKHDNVFMFFTTLWSLLPPDSFYLIQQSINDFKYIKYGDRTLTPEMYNFLHYACKGYLASEIPKYKNEKTIVVTHHVPTALCNDPKYKTSDLNPAFVIEMFNFIEKQSIDYWIYGHHHSNMPEQIINGTKLVTNQFGYIFRDTVSNYNNQAYFEL